MTTTVKSQHFGVTKSGEEVTLFTIASASGACEVGVINYGATLVFLRVLDHNGKLDDVVAGFADMEGLYFQQSLCIFLCQSQFSVQTVFVMFWCIFILL